MRPVKIIAEIGWNHMGDMKLAKRMIKSASKSGADICKFQTWNVEKLKPGPWDSDGRRQIYEKAQLKKNDYKILISECKKNKVEFLTSVFNQDDMNFLKKLKLKSIKIPSHEIYNLKLIESSIKNFNTIYISAGATKFFELKKIFKIIKKKFKKNIFLKHCVSSYPLKDENVNLQDVLVQTDQKLEGIKRPTGVRRKPWDPKDKREGEKQLKCAMRALEENRVARLARKEIEEAIWKFVTLRSRNNFEERDLLYKLLDRPKPYISAKKFQFNILKKMGIRITDAILKEFVAKYGHAGKTEEATIHFDNMVSSFRKLAAHEKIDFFGGQGKMGKVYLRNNHYVASKDIESLMHKKIIERGNSKMGQFKQTFLMFAPERFEGSTGPGAWLQHFSAIEDEQKAGSHNLLREGAPQTQRSCASQATTITETPRTVARRYAFAQKRASNQGITASLLRQRLENFGIAVSEDQAAALFAKYDTDNNGQLSFYEFARRAVPPDYQGKGALYNLCGGESIDKGDRRNGYRPSSKTSF